VLPAEIDSVGFYFFLSTDGLDGDDYFWFDFFIATGSGGLFFQDIDEVPA